ncbi:GrpB family protein [Marinicella sp. W31]|uniref:GrpB family protein n=1 Tax=Marinicella sp. W31 TaxID=3023713 RepID=UPI003756E5BE
MSYLYPHKPHWKQDYINARDLIMSGFDASLRLYHIGSTAIEGLYAKDCIDILGVTDDLDKVISNKQYLMDSNYVYKGEYGIPGRAYFSKNSRKVHLHVLEHGHDQIIKHLGFIHFMRNNSSYIAELNALKTRLQDQYPHDKEAYQLEKKPFYDKIHRLSTLTQKDIATL